MTLQPINASGSQRYNPPAAFNAAADLSLLRNFSGIPSVRGIGAPRITRPVLVEKGRNQGDPDLYWTKLEWGDARGGIRQYGRAEESMAMIAAGDAYCDAPDILRHAFLTSADNAPDPTAIGNRCTTTNFIGVMLAALGESGATPSLFREVSATNPIMTTVAGFARPGSNQTITNLRTVEVNGVEYALICWLTSGGGANTLQYISDLANPPTGGTLPIGTGATTDVIQVPVYEDALLVLNDRFVYRAAAANTAIGAVAFTKVETVPRGGYWIGLMGAGVGVGTPCVAGVFSKTGGPLMTSDPALGSVKGKILIFSLAGLLLGEKPVKTPWVTHATKFGDGYVYCDQATHYYYDGHSDIPVEKAADIAANSDRKRVCMGHKVRGDKFFWTVNETISAGGAGATVRYEMEYDLYLNTSYPSSAHQTLSTTGLLTVGGPNLPVSDQNGFMHDYTDGSWYRQYQSPSSIIGYNERWTTGAADGTGQQFESTTNYATTKVEIPGADGDPKVVARWMGPLNSQMAGAALIMGVTGQQPFTINSGPTKERRLMKDFGTGLDSWFRGPLQLSCTSVQTVIGTNATRTTPNLYPQSIEVFFRHKGPLHSTKWAGWDADGDPR